MTDLVVLRRETLIDIMTGLKILAELLQSNAKNNVPSDEENKRLEYVNRLIEQSMEEFDKLNPLPNEN